MKIPKLCRRRDRNLAFIYDGTKKVYFGKWGEPETLQRYADYIDALINGVDAIVGERSEERIVTLADLVAAFVEAHGQYYVNRMGEQTGQLARIQTAFQIPLRLFADLPVDEFGALKLQLCRQEMIDSDRFSRTYLNTLVHCIRHVFQFGVANELVKPETLQSLKAVPAIKRGRTTLREAEPIIPVDANVVNATIAHLAPTLAAMVKLQRLTGMRPGEVCIMKRVDVDCRDPLWTYTLAHDKTDYRRDVNDRRTIPLGERAQKVVAPFIARKKKDEYLFSPADAQQERSEALRSQRATPITAQTRLRDSLPTRRSYSDHYSVTAYGRAIERACRAAGVPKWSPNQLRHLYATEIRAKYGLEAAQIMLGHAHADVTQIYAERDQEKMRQIAMAEG